MTTAAELKKKSAELAKQLEETRKAEKEAKRQEFIEKQRKMSEEYDRQVEEALESNVYNLDEYRKDYPTTFNKVMSFITVELDYSDPEEIAEYVGEIMDIAMIAVQEAK